MALARDETGRRKPELRDTKSGKGITQEMAPRGFGFDRKATAGDEKSARTRRFPISPGHLVLVVAYLSCQGGRIRERLRKAGKAFTQAVADAAGKKVAIISARRSTLS